MYYVSLSHFKRFGPVHCNPTGRGFTGCTDTSTARISIFGTVRGISLGGMLSDPIAPTPYI